MQRQLSSPWPGEQRGTSLTLTFPSCRTFLSSGRCSAVRSRRDLMSRRCTRAIRYRSSSCEDTAGHGGDTHSTGGQQGLGPDRPFTASLAARQGSWPIQGYLCDKGILVPYKNIFVIKDTSAIQRYLCYKGILVPYRDTCPQHPQLA